MKKLESKFSNIGLIHLYQDGEKYFVLFSYTAHGELHGHTNLHIETLLYSSDSHGNILSMIPILQYKRLVPDKEVMKDYEKLYNSSR